MKLLDVLKKRGKEKMSNLVKKSSWLTLYKALAISSLCNALLAFVIAIVYIKGFIFVPNLMGKYPLVTCRPLSSEVIYYA